MPPTPMPPTPTAIASPSLAANAQLLGRLETIALQVGDLSGIGETFVEFDFGPTQLVDALPAPQGPTDRFGRLGGWKARYRQSPEVTTGVLVVDSRVDVFPDAEAAVADLDAYSERYSDQAGEPGAAMSHPAVGDAATMLAIVPADETHVRSAMLAWRSGPFTGQVVTSGLGDVDVSAAAVTLATAVAQRMSSAVDAN
jgi:hypothetical protein